MDIEKLRSLIKDSLDSDANDSDAKVIIESNDGHHFDAIVISDEFIGKSLLQRQRKIFKPLSEYISSGDLHALSLKAYTNKEWNTKSE